MARASSAWRWVLPLCLAAPSALGAPAAETCAAADSTDCPSGDEEVGLAQLRIAKKHPPPSCNKTEPWTCGSTKVIAFLTAAGKQCRADTMEDAPDNGNNGLFATKEACAQFLVRDPSCPPPYLFMWADGYSDKDTSWHCRCCKGFEPVDNPKKHWSMYNAKLHVAAPSKEKCEAAKFAFVIQRHGQSLSNAGVGCKPDDPPLTSKGLNQAKTGKSKYAEWTSAQNPYGKGRYPDIVFASALMRAQQSAGVTFGGAEGGQKNQVHVADYIAEVGYMWQGGGTQYVPKCYQTQNRRRNLKTTSCSLFPSTQRDRYQKPEPVLDCDTKVPQIPALVDLLNYDAVNAARRNSNSYVNMHFPSWGSFTDWVWLRQEVGAIVANGFAQNKEAVILISVTTHGAFIKDDLTGEHPDSAAMYYGDMRLNCKQGAGGWYADGILDSKVNVKNNVIWKGES